MTRHLQINAPTPADAAKTRRLLRRALTAITQLGRALFDVSNWGARTGSPEDFRGCALVTSAELACQAAMEELGADDDTLLYTFDGGVRSAPTPDAFRRLPRYAAGACRACRAALDAAPDCPETRLALAAVAAAAGWVLEHLRRHYAEPTKTQAAALVAC